MGASISLTDILKMWPLLVFLLPLFIPKKQGYEYNALDKKGYVINLILSVVYVVLSIIGFSTIFFADAPKDMNSPLKNSLIDIVISIGFSIPLLSIVSILTSAIARKRGKSKFSFTIQFLPIPVFVVMVALVFFMERA